jgi:hypothetical protein
VKRSELGRDILDLGEVNPLEDRKVPRVAVDDVGKRLDDRPSRPGNDMLQLLR